MALDNIQKSILTVLGISGMVAFLTPANIDLKEDKNKPGQVKPRDELAPPPAAAAVPDENTNNEYTADETMPAFGQPTISGLPYSEEGQQQQADPDSPNQDIPQPTNDNTSGQTQLPSGAVIQDGKILY